MQPTATLTNTRNANGVTSRLAITGLHDVEEDIWSPTYGLKGKVDASVQATITERNALVSTSTSYTMPFEIKTGRAAAGMEHRAQTLLYTLLIAERYGVDVPGGLLYYTQSEEVVRVPAGRNELRGLIMARNEMAGYVVRRMKTSKREDAKEGHAEVVVEEAFLPPTIDDERVCGRCYVNDACMLYRKVSSPAVYPNL